MMVLDEEKKLIVKNAASHEAINEFLQRLRETEGDNLMQVILFGSVARGDDHEDSDIDIFILLKNHDKTSEKIIALISLNKQTTGEAGREGPLVGATPTTPLNVLFFVHDFENSCIKCSRTLSINHLFSMKNS